MNENNENPLANMMIFIVMIGGIFEFFRKQGPKILGAIGGFFRGLVDFLIAIVSFLAFPTLILLSLVALYCAGKWLYQNTWKRMANHEKQLEDIWSTLATMESKIKDLETNLSTKHNSHEGRLNKQGSLLLKLKNFTGYSAYEQSQKALKEMAPNAQPGGGQNEQA